MTSAALPQKNLELLRYLRPYLKKHRATAFGAVLAILAASAAVLAFGQGLRAMVDQGFGANDTAHLDRAFLFLAPVVVLLACSSAARHYLASSLGEKMTADLRQDLFAHLLKLGAGFFESRPSGDMVSRLTADTGLLQNVVTVALPIALRNSILLLGAGAMLFITNLKLAAIVFLTVPLVVGPLIFVGRKLRLLSRRAQDRIGESGAFAAESLGFIKTVQAYTHESLDLEKFNGLTHAALNAALSRSLARALLSGLIIALAFGAILAVLWIGAYDVMRQNISGGELAAFVFYSILAAGSVAALSEVAGEMHRAGGALDRIVEFLSVIPENSPSKIPSTSAATPQGESAIAFENICFSYPSRPNQNALDHVSFKVSPKENLGIIGASGSGKSTVFQLLLGFYRPQSGRILLHGQDIASMDLKDLRQKISFVSQEPVIFSTTLLENIRYGKPGATEQEVRQACKDALVDEFLYLLPGGLNSHLGEKGVKLSGGQKQRIAIARALIRNPEILLLDEATSQLDSDNERLVQEALDSLSQGRTTLTIAHRLSTLRKADRIMTLNNGKIGSIYSAEEFNRNNVLDNESALPPLRAI